MVKQRSVKPRNGGPRSGGVVVCRSPFASWSDADFYSSKAQHVYFYNNMVDAASVRELRKDIHLANQDVVEDGMVKAPKPIVVHVHSPGGDLVEGMRLMSIFQESRVPICTLIEGSSASAATFLTVLAPYRVMTRYASTLLHEYSTVMWGKAQDVKHDLDMVERNFSFIKEMYLRRTRIGRAELSELLGHDLMLDASTSLKMGVVDRVIDPTPAADDRRRGRAHEALPTHVVLVKTNFNRLTASCDVAADCKELDRMVADGGDDLRPLVFYPHRFCMDSASPVYDAFVFLPRIQAMTTPCYSVLDTNIDIVDYIPSLFCTKRFMYESAMVVFFLRSTMLWGQLLDDRIQNTRMFMGLLRGILKARTKLPDAILDDIPRRGFTLNAQECLEYGLCDEIVSL
jgi:ATP-dependent protease ClpP protease subunit